MEKQVLRNLCLNKLSMTVVNGSKHEHFCPTYQGEPIELFHVLRLSRGTGESGKNNQKSIAKVLNMSLRELESTSRCNIGATATYLGICTQVLKRAKLIIELDPIVNPWSHISLVFIKPLMGIAREKMKSKKGKGSKDKEYLLKLSSEVKELKRDSQGDFQLHVKQLSNEIERQLTQ